MIPAISPSTSLEPQDTQLQVSGDDLAFTQPELKTLPTGSSR